MREQTRNCSSRGFGLGSRDSGTGMSSSSSSSSSSSAAASAAAPAYSYSDSEEEEEDVGEVSKKLFLVRSFVQRLREHPWQSFAQVQAATGVDLSAEDSVLSKLRLSPLIKVDAELEQIKFEPRVDVRDVPTLLAALKKFPDGISLQEIEDCGPDGVVDCVFSAIVWGLVIAVRNKQTGGNSAPIVLYPRGPLFLVPLSGTFSVEPGKRRLQSSVDVTAEVRRAEALVVGVDALEAVADAGASAASADAVGKRCLRVSAETTDFSDEGGQDHERIVESLRHSATPFSRSTALPPPPMKEEFTRVISDSKLPVAPEYLGPPLRNAQVFRHGCTNDVKDVWRKVVRSTPFHADQAKTLDRMLLQNNLATAEWLGKKAQSLRKKNRPVAAKKRRRGRVSTAQTNAHMDMPPPSMAGAEKGAE